MSCGSECLPAGAVKLGSRAGGRSTDVPELLLELLSEEIPARMQHRAIANLTELLRDNLAAAEIPATNLRGYATPRRLAIIADGIPEVQPDRTEERRGPRVGAPRPAIDGFLRSAALASTEQCEIRDTGRGEFYFAALHHPGRPAAQVLPEVIRAAMAELPWPKSMRAHQKYFSCVRADGTPAPRFLFVANNVAADGGKTIIAGNERVLRARLADARFFWDQDRKAPLAARVEALKNRVFHANLGDLFFKAERMAAVAEFLSPYLRSESQRASRAAWLAKADLSTGMVGEFPELQGVMGRYYALNDGEEPDVAEAIAEHYKPLGPSDTCPTRPASVVVALADKIDSLVGFFGIDEKPSGSRDPFALRRAALGVIRLILENQLRLPLTDAFRRSFE